MLSNACPDPEPASADTAKDRAATFSIGQLAKEFGVSLRTLRFYEGKGFVVPRRSGAVRLYSQTDHDRIAVMLSAKRLGFTLREIGEMLAAGERDPTSLNLTRSQCTEQINLLERQKRAIDTALAELRRAYSSQYLRALGVGGREPG